MAIFETAVAITLEKEGGYRNVPGDSGGATNFVISLTFLKRFGLKYDFNGDGVVDEKEIRDLTVANAKIVYKNEIWDKLNLSRITAQLVANKIFDLVTNMGEPQAIKLVQRAVWAITCERSNLADDGILGERTMTAINTWGAQLLPPLRAAQDSFYRLVARVRLEAKRELEGWLNRCYSL